MPRNNSRPRPINSKIILNPEVRNKIVSAPVVCPALQPPVLPFPTDIPPPCERNEQFYSSPLFCHTVRKPLLLILILSDVAKFGERQRLRRSWTRSTFHMEADFIKTHPWAYSFVVGHPRGSVENVMKSVDAEQCHYKDVLTVDVLEDYYNLTWKKMDAMEYLVKSGLDFEVLLKTDTDVFVNIQLVLEWLPGALSQTYEKSNPSVRPFFAGLCERSLAPIRDSKSKWYLSENHYPHSKFPPFCYGTAYFLSLDLVEAILKVNDSKKAFRIEDVHTGMLVEETGLVPGDHLVDPGRIYQVEPGKCSGSRHEYPFAVMKNDPANLFYYNEFMQSSCK